MTDVDIRVFSRRDVETGVLMDLQEAVPTLRLACISITDPDCRLAQILIHRRDTVKILRLPFHDVTPDIELKFGTYTAMTLQQAILVVRFVQTIRNQVDVLAVHCEMGISRSAGVAAACAELLGQDNDHFFFNPYRPNRYCYDLVLAVAEGKQLSLQGDPMTSAYLTNIDAVVVEVNHSKLERISETSCYRSKCPVCPDGILLMGRDQGTLKLLEYDRCVSCGQLVRYLDIDQLRHREGG